MRSSSSACRSAATATTQQPGGRWNRKKLPASMADTGIHIPASQHEHLPLAPLQGEHLPWKFFSVVFGLAVPFWVMGGTSTLPLPVELPTSALVAFLPVTAASILVHQQAGFRGVKAFWKQAFDYRKIKNKTWYLPILLLLPSIYGLSYAFMRLAGLPLPDPVKLPLHLAPVFFGMYLIPAAGEELGWMGYAIDPLQSRWGALKGSLIFGCLYAAWHAIPFLQTNHSTSWVFWQLLGEFPLRVLYVWVYNNTGKSVFATIFFHAINNVSWSLFPNYGSHYNPLVTGVITLIAAVTVVLRWGRNLSRIRDNSL